MTLREIKEKGLLLLECVSGSKVYGLDTPQSDIDIRGVFYLPETQFYGLHYTPQVSDERNDAVYYELGRFVELLLKNNPNMLELLATPNEYILFRHPLMERLNLELFLSGLCKDTFAGYALAQVRKARGLNKKILNPVDRKRKSVLDFCFVLRGYSSIPFNQWLVAEKLLQEQCGLVPIPHAKGVYALFYDRNGTKAYRGVVSNEAANEVSLSSVQEGEQPAAFLSFNQEAYSSYCREYREYWAWVEKRNESRYLGNMTHSGGYDAKNMMHTIRLLHMAEDILKDGRIQLRCRNRELLLSIKAGAFSYETLLQMADQLMLQIIDAAVHSPLPALPDVDTAEAILVAIRKELYCK